MGNQQTSGEYVPGLSSVRPSIRASKGEPKGACTCVHGFHSRARTRERAPSTDEGGLSEAGEEDGRWKKAGKGGRPAGRERVGTRRG